METKRLRPAWNPVSTGFIKPGGEGGRKTGLGGEESGLHSAKEARQRGKGLELEPVRKDFRENPGDMLCMAEPKGFAFFCDISERKEK